MASNSLVTVSTLAKNNEKIKEQLATKVNIDQGVDNKGKLLGVNDLGQVSLVDTPDSVKVSQAEGNAIETKDDGIYVSTVSETKVSEAENNAIEVKDDGIYVAPTDLTNYVEKVNGKGLSTNDLTDELKEQYDKAEENVQSDWNETDETSDAFIKNKPTIPSTDGLATETFVTDKIAEAQLGGEEVDLSGYVKTETLTEELTKYSTTEVSDEKYVLDEEIEVLDVVAIEQLLGLSTEELEGLSQIIDDSSVRIDKTNSSSFIYQSIQDAIATGKEFTLSEIAKASTASYKVVDSTTNVTDFKYIYLIANSSNSYDMYILDEIKGAIPIGETTIDLSGYITEEFANQTYVLQTVFDVLSGNIGDVANLTTTDKTVVGAINELKDAVDNATIEISTDENNQLENRENGLYVGKVDISTTLDENSTDTQVVSAKAVYDELQNIADEIAKVSDVEEIQSTTKSDDISLGWYRIAEYIPIPATWSKGIAGNSCIISIKKASTTSETHLIRLNSTVDGQEFVSLGSKSDDQNITKIRYTYDNTKAYIEIYKNNSTPYGISITILDTKDTNTYWKTITPIATEETVDGVTVTTTYDIPKDVNILSNNDLVVALDDTVTDTQVPSAKVVYDELQNVDAKTLEGKSASDFLSIEGGTVNNSVEILENGDETLSRTIVTTANGGTSYFVNRDTNDARRQIKIEPVEINSDVNSALKYETSESGEWVSNTVIHSGNIGKYTLATTIPDVDVTTITNPEGLTGKISYMVRNGICYVSLEGVSYNTIDTNLEIDGLPKTLMYQNISLHTRTETLNRQGHVYMRANETILNLWFYTLNAVAYGAFCYPVAEE